MKYFADDREMYLAYRLRELPPEERKSTEERMLSDDAFSDRMQEAEYDLLDDYRAGRLAPADCRRMESVFSREDLLRPAPFASQMQLVGGVAALPKPRSKSRPIFRIGFSAAALALMAASGWMVTAGFRHNASQSSSVERIAPFVSPTTGPNQVRSSQEPSHGVTAVLLLTPTISRGGLTAQLRLLPTTRTILVQWVVSPNQSGRAFSLSVLRDGKQVALVTQSRLRRIEGSDVAEFSLARATFSGVGPHLRYILLVRKSGSAGGTEAEYPVVVSVNP